RVIRNLDCLFVGVIWDYRENRPEDLFLSYRHVVVDVPENGWPDEIPFSDALRGVRSSSDQNGPFRDAFTNVATNTLQLRRRYEATEFDALLSWVAHLE